MYLLRILVTSGLKYFQIVLLALSMMVLHHSSAMLQRFAAVAARSNQKTTFVFANSINNSQAPSGACLKTLYGMKTIRIYANVNPLTPNSLEVVDVSTGHCCSEDSYLSDVMPKQVRLLKSKGYRVRVQISEISFVNVDDIVPYDDK